MDRSNASRYLNTLYKKNKLTKTKGRPVLYKTVDSSHQKKPENTGTKSKESGFSKMVGASQSLALAIEKAKSAIMYPPKGIHTLILGETGVGKSLFAEQMYDFAKTSRLIDESGPFIRFNCADYVDNPGLLTAQIFGVKKGAYTGAEEDRDGLLKHADKGMLFLDEVHRLPPQGQEILFNYIDKGCFRPLGEADRSIFVDVRYSSGYNGGASFLSIENIQKTDTHDYIFTQFKSKKLKGKISIDRGIFNRRIP